MSKQCERRVADALARVRRLREGHAYVLGHLCATLERNELVSLRTLESAVAAAEKDVPAIDASRAAAGGNP